MSRFVSSMLREFPGTYPTALPPLLARSPQTARIEGGLGE
jgi:hypothetical protein